MRKLATISDVARLSGYSVSTVSRVINNKPHVTEEKRQRIQDAMDKLGYTPLQAARQLRGSGSGTIAVAVPSITNSFFAYLVDAIERTGVEYGYKTLVTQTHGSKPGEELTLNLLKLHQVDGVVLCSIENDWSHIESFGAYGKLVVCNEYCEHHSLSTICGKQYQGFYDACGYLLGKGHKKLGYCTGRMTLTLQPKGRNIDSDRYLGYAEALGDAGLTPDPRWLFPSGHTMEDGRKIMRQLLPLSDRPDAIVAGSDEVAAGMVMEALRSGIRVPEDIAILGVDDQPIAACLAVPLTTIAQPVKEEGQNAALELIRQIGENDSTPVKKELDLKLVVRASA